MSIRTRIHKIESAMNSDSGFCVCRNVNRFEIWKADLGEDSDTSEPHLDGAPVPEMCAECRRPIQKQKLIVQLCDRTTPDRFPEEWSAKN